MNRRVSAESKEKMTDGIARLVFAAMLLAAGGCTGVARAKAAPAGTASLPAPGTYSLDPPHTFIYFAAQHKVVGKVRGRFDKMTGTLVVGNDPAACSVDITIDTASVDTQNSVRDADLRGPDFFDAAKFPKITYRAHGIRRSGAGWVVDGSLTIRNVTKRAPLAFRFNGTAKPEASKPSRAGFQATAAVNRADFAMTRELLDEIGRQSAAPDVWIEIDTEALAADARKQ
jgi:polyisoprenoid-binding protein YceI